jgi:fumarylacetoacetase
METGQTFLEIPQDSDFSIENIPFGVFSLVKDPTVSHCATRLGDWVIDLTVFEREGHFTGPLFTELR